MDTDKKLIEKKKKKRVVIAMSGGVDSSVAAALLCEEGYEVIGMTMQLWDYGEIEEKTKVGEPSNPEGSRGSCCSLEDVYDARRVCDKLGIPFYVVNMEESFKREVVDYFVEGYQGGKTPNPCVKCNEVMKFEILMRKAMELEADYLATGHYAGITKDSNGIFHLCKGKDESKDQSYFLFTMNQDELSKVLFPLGGLKKVEVREHAKRLGLRVHEKKDSQEICFIEDDSYSNFLENAFETKGAKLSSGNIIDTAGNILGKHLGLYRYTVGQRKGLNIGGPGGPYYVTTIDTQSGNLVVGSDNDLFSRGLKASGLRWTHSPLVEGAEIFIKLRYGHKGARAVIKKIEDDKIELVFDNPERAVAPGQAVVFYKGSELFGGAWIECETR